MCRREQQTVRDGVCVWRTRTLGTFLKRALRTGVGREDKKKKLRTTSTRPSNGNRWFRCLHFLYASSFVFNKFRRFGRLLCVCVFFPFRCVYGFETLSNGMTATTHMCLYAYVRMRRFFCSLGLCWNFVVCVVHIYTPPFIQWSKYRVVCFGVGWFLLD